MTGERPIDRQSGVEIGDFVSDSDHRVAHGSRRGSGHYVADADQIVRVSHLDRPAVLPPEEATANSEVSTNIVQDVGIVRPEPSVWDASPQTPDDPAKDDPGAGPADGPP
jgi:hypothetical protein